MKNLVFTYILCFISSGVIAQEVNQRIGEWRSFYPYTSARFVTQSEDRVYYMTNEALLSYDKESKSSRVLSTTEGLTDASIQTIRYSPYEDLLLIAYSNSGFDLVTENDITYINDILVNPNISGSRQINDIYFENRQFVYLSSDFGIVQYDLQRREFGFTTFTELPIEKTIIYKDRFYASSEDGIFSISTSDEFNPADFQAWSLLGPQSGLPAVYNAGDMTIFNDMLYVIIDEVVYRSDDGQNFSVYMSESGFNALYLSSESKHLLIGWECESSCNGMTFIIDENGDIEREGSGCVNRPVYAIEDQQGRIWYADRWREIRYEDSPGDGCSGDVINAPFSKDIFSLTARNDHVYLSAGGVNSFFGFRYIRDGWSTLNPDGDWERVNNQNTKFLRDNDITDILYVLPDPRDPNTVYAGSYGHGLIRYRGPEDIFVYDQNNSTLDGTATTANLERVSGMAFDEQNNLWISNYLASRPLSVFKQDSTWQSFSLPTTTLTQVAIDRNGYKWIIERGQNSGFLVFDEGDMDDPSDDRVKRFSTSNSELQSNVVTSIRRDRDGDMWVGTEAGPVTFDCSDAFESCTGFRQKVDEDGFIAFLLETETINAIAVDGANRKWFGTLNGVFVQSPNGEEEIHHFTSENSPLPSDIISAIDIDQKRGIVYIGTALGLVSYRTDATEGSLFHQSDIQVFPNPVRPDYQGPIAIEGLAEDALVKITDAFGNIVTEMQANGGQAVWNGTDLSGQQVATGVYLVYSSTLDDLREPDAAVAKILFVR